MSKLVCIGAIVNCSGSAAGMPQPYSVLPANNVLIGDAAAATVLDRKAGSNIPSFGVCRITATPQPCIPAIIPPLPSGSPTVLIGNSPAQTEHSRYLCGRGGVITFGWPGQTTIEIP